MKKKDYYMNNNSENNLEKIKTQISFLKEKLDNIDKTLNVQEEAINTLHENSKSLLLEAMTHENSSVKQIMKTAFTKGKIPDIFFKQ